MTIIPPYLKKGDTIGITCPAGYMAADKATNCIHALQLWGYEVMVGRTLGSTSKNYFSASDEERLEELQAMLDDHSIHAILFGRGGYGMGRIIDKLDFKKFKKHPKWLIGFSDITVLHMHVFNKLNIACMHAPMAAAFNIEPGTNEYIRLLGEALAGSKTKITAASHPLNQPGKCSGILTGGNLTLLSNIIGTKSDFKTKNMILFLEDTGEYLYSLDRMLYHLKRSRKFSDVAGIIFGGFTDMKDTERPFGNSTQEILKNIISNLSCPVCFDFPVSHLTKNVSLKIGVKYSLKVTPGAAILEEL